MSLFNFYNRHTEKSLLSVNKQHTKPVTPCDELAVNEEVKTAPLEDDFEERCFILGYN